MINPYDFLQNRPLPKAPDSSKLLKVSAMDTLLGGSGGWQKGKWITYSQPKVTSLYAGVPMFTQPRQRKQTTNPWGIMNIAKQQYQNAIQQTVPAFDNHNRRFVSYGQGWGQEDFRSPFA